MTGLELGIHSASVLLALVYLTQDSTNANSIPTSCAQILENNPNAVDAEYIIQIGGSLRMLTKVWCHNMAMDKSPRAVEYLTLSNQASNSASYYCGEICQKNNNLSRTVQTVYQKVRLIVHKHATAKDYIASIDITDTTFSRSTGQICADNAKTCDEKHGNLVRNFMPFGTAGSYEKPIEPGNTAGFGYIDIESTQFRISTQQQWAGYPSSAAGTSSFTHLKQCAQLIAFPNSDGSSRSFFAPQGYKYSATEKAIARKVTSQPILKLFTKAPKSQPTFRNSVQWHLSNKSGTSCTATCAEVGSGCIEGYWPTSDDGFINTIVEVSQTLESYPFNPCQYIQPGYSSYNPSVKKIPADNIPLNGLTGVCYWSPPLFKLQEPQDAEEVGTPSKPQPKKCFDRCHLVPKKDKESVYRFCPCVKLRKPIPSGCNTQKGTIQLPNNDN